MATQPWLDSLSDDWVSQSRSSSPSPHAGHISSVSHNASDLCSHPQSRIPRPKTQAISTKPGTDQRPQRSVSGSAKPRTALTERSLNIEKAVAAPAAEQDEEVAPRDMMGSRSFSGSSAASVVRCATVGRAKPGGPAREGRREGTPEWKRRLLKGQMGYGEQRDLFSPIGLENIFQQQSMSIKGSRDKKFGLSRLIQIESMPSSPPPWPLAFHKDAATVEADTNGRNDRLSVLGEAAEESAEVSSAPNGEAANEASLHVSTAESGESSLHGVSTSHESGTALERRDDAILQSDSRVVSGQTELRNEQFSPVFLTQNNTIDGRYNPAALETMAGQLMEQMNKLEISRKAARHVSGAEVDSVDSREQASSAKLEEETLPADLSVGTPDIAVLGDFVSVKRGAYFASDSFRRRPLSPSPTSQEISASEPGIGSSGIPHDYGKSAGHNPPSKAASRSTTPPGEAQAPVTPARQRAEGRLSPEKNQSSGSPLKLFGNHDTFTSHRLLRRMSQLEDTIAVGEAVGEIKVASGTNVLRTSGGRRAKDGITIQTTVEEELTIAEGPGVGQRQVSNGSRFGQGELDNYEFPERTLLRSPNSDMGNEDPSTSPSPSVNPPGSRAPKQFRRGSWVESTDPANRSSKPSQSSVETVIDLKTSKFPLSNQHGANFVDNAMRTAFSDYQHEFNMADGKRPQTSPGKSPAPKRRRTLQRTDLEDDHGPSLMRPANVLAQSMIGKKRDDARPDRVDSQADPEVLALRQMLRPRNPTPSQRRSRHFSTESMRKASNLKQPREGSNTVGLDPELLNAESMPASTLPVIKEVLVGRARLPRRPDQDERKHSLTTQDYLDEAMRVMSWIRKNGRPKSGLESLEEGQESSAGEEEDEEDIHVASSLTFSRPPSRDGATGGWRVRAQANVDPRALSQLRKFEDKDDDDFMASSIQSLRIGPKRQGIVNQSEEPDKDLDGSIRIRGPPTVPFDGPAPNDGTRSSQRSLDFSSGRTVGTNISRKSDNVATLAPDVVAHLIPHEIAGMTFDKEKNIWVKTRSPRKDVTANQDVSAVTGSDEDPLGKIPDLTVDEIQELQTIALTAGPGLHIETHTRAAVELSQKESQGKSVPQGEDVVSSRPCTRDSGIPPPIDSSSAPSKYHRSTFSVVQTETRATSWSDQGMAATLAKSKQQASIPSMPHVYVDNEQVEHEIRIDECRGVNPRRPVLQETETAPMSYTEAFERRNSKHHLGPKDPPNQESRDPQSSNLKENGYAIPSSPAADHVSGALPASASVGKAFVNRFFPHTEERSEVSIITPGPNRRQLNFSVSVSKPMALPKSGLKALVPTPATPSSRADVTLYLSDLPDFTINQVDERELPDRVLSKREVASALRMAESRFGLATMDLVKQLQDAEPDEPFWDELRQLELRDKGLTTLHMLDEFCYRVEGLDVAGNELSQLNGAPTSIRRLNAQRNSLSSLTSWAHLTNLQYLDVSLNGIDNLSALNCLIHLRELRANDNAITSLDGIMGLDGLISLSLEGNQLRAVDFEGADLTRLSELNLSRNQLSVVENLHCLPALKQLNLDRNLLRYFPTQERKQLACGNLLSLKLRENLLESFHIGACFPSLRLLYVDKNRLSEIPDLHASLNLEVFSVREQNLRSQTTNISNMQTASLFMQHCDVRTAYLSGNVIPSLNLPHDFLNLTHLELASSGLLSLPEKFGQLAPNIRVLNLSFNALKDIKPLLNIKKLSELYLAGNRLCRLRKTTTVLSKLTSLTRLDLRDNPFTVGFYLPALRNQLVTSEAEEPSDDGCQAYLLPPGDEEKDQAHVARLDDTTRLRRRVYEMLLASSCPNLQTLDGLHLVKDRVLVRDEIWERLLLLGVVRKSAG